MSDIRWMQRFQNYHRIVISLESALKGREIESFSDLEKGGISRWFEMSFELLWKLLKDYLEQEEVEIGTFIPKKYVKDIGGSGIVGKNGCGWERVNENA